MQFRNISLSILLAGLIFFLLLLFEYVWTLQTWKAALQGAGSVRLWASLLLLLQLLSWEEAPSGSKEGWSVTQNQVRGGGEEGIRDWGRNSSRRREKRMREFLALQKLQCKNRRGMLIIMRSKILGEKEADELRDLEVFKTSRGDWLMNVDSGRGCWTLCSAAGGIKEGRADEESTKTAWVALSSFESYI